jgi:nucleotide-binding universal stress UspA family protein
VFPTVQKFASFFGARIHLLKVNTLESFETTRESKQAVEQFIANHNIQDYEFTLYNDLVKEVGIIHFAKDINADIIALGTHGRNGLNNMFSTSITEDLVNHSFCPVFTVNFQRNKA